VSCSSSEIKSRQSSTADPFIKENGHPGGHQSWEINFAWLQILLVVTSRTESGSLNVRYNGLCTTFSLNQTMKN